MSNKSREAKMYLGIQKKFLFLSTYPQSDLGRVPYVYIISFNPILGSREYPLPCLSAEMGA
jgi:hypothetical protein